LIHVRECFKNEALKGQRTTFLLERTSLHFLVRVLKNVKDGLDVNRVEKSLISSFNPVDDVTEILHGLAVSFEE
jgi:hypothetical protein